MTAVSISTGGAIAIGVGIDVLGVLLLLSVLVILVLAGRSESDPRGMRPFSCYLMAVSWVGLVVAFVGSLVIVSALVQLIGSHPYSIRDATARSVVVGGLVMLLALGAVMYHLRRGLRIARGDGRPDGASARVLHSYVSAAAFVFVIVAVVAFGFAVYFVFQLAGPGVFANSASRTDIWRSLIEALYVNVASITIVGIHLKWGPPDLSPGLRRLRGQRPPPVVPAPDPGPAPTMVTSTAMPSSASGTPGAPSGQF